MRVERKISYYIPRLFKLKKDEGMAVKFKNIFHDKINLIENLYEQLCVNYDVEVLHKFRVNLRKIYAYNEVFGKKINEEDSRKFKNLLKKIIKPTSVLRDLDLFLIEIDQMHCSEETKRKLYDTFTLQRDSIVQDFSKPEYRENLQSLKSIMKKNRLFEYNFQKLDKITILRSISIELSREFDKINEATPLEKLHKLRIKFKKFRYALEMYLNYFNDENKEIDNFYNLKELQDLFGTIQDNSIRIEFIESLENGFENDEIIFFKNEMNLKISNAKNELFALVGKKDV